LGDRRGHRRDLQAFALRGLQTYLAPSCRDVIAERVGIVVAIVGATAAGKGEPKQVAQDRPRQPRPCGFQVRGLASPASGASAGPPAAIAIGANLPTAEATPRPLLPGPRFGCSFVLELPAEPAVAGNL
jgi:hypothetical protein